MNAMVNAFHSQLPRLRFEANKSLCVRAALTSLVFIGWLWVTFVAVTATGASDPRSIYWWAAAVAVTGLFWSTVMMIRHALVVVIHATVPYFIDSSIGYFGETLIEVAHIYASEPLLFPAMLKIGEELSKTLIEMLDDAAPAPAPAPASAPAAAPVYKRRGKRAEEAATE